MGENKMLRSVGKVIKRAHGIYVNNAVDLSSTKVFGFDYDYTLAEYQTATTKFIYDCALNYLVEKYGYPSKIRQLPYDPDFIIRGLFFDPKHSVMMKLDSYSVIDANAVFIGLERVSDQELSNIYSTRRMGVHRLDKNFRGTGKHGFYQVLDDFSMPEAYLLQSVVQFFRDEELRFEPLLMYRTIRAAISDVHISQALYRNVTENKELHLGPAESMRSVVSYLAHKEMFIISNSPFWFINMGMTHLVGHDWRDAFEVVICEAGKPDFFIERNRPFLEMKETKVSTPQKQRYEKRENWTSAAKLEKGKIYYEGCLAEFGRLTEWDQKSVLYFGDQINADLAEPSLRFGWRTAAVIPELSEEIDIYGSQEFRVAKRNLLEVQISITNYPYFIYPFISTLFCIQGKSQ